MSEIPKISLAYAAGFIDGDGSVCVQSPDDVVVYASNSHREALEPFIPSFGGSIGPPIVDSRNPHWKPMNAWVRSIDKQGGFLAALEPHLLLKKKQAQLGLRLASRKSVEVRRQFLGWRYGCIGMSKEERSQRAALANEIARLNDQPCNCPHVGFPSLDYFAGMFDAEGCVGIYRHKKTAVRVVVNVSIRCKWILDQYQTVFGGWVCRGHGCWQWQCSSRVAQRFLLAVGPRMVLKQPRALKALELYRHITGKQFRVWTPDHLEAIERIKFELHAMNSKGVQMSMIGVL